MKNYLKVNNLNTTTVARVFEIPIEYETKKTLGQKLKYSVSFINKLMRMRKIPFVKMGRTVRFILGDVVAALQKGSTV